VVCRVSKQARGPGRTANLAVPTDGQTAEDLLMIGVVADEPQTKHRYVTALQPSNKNAMSSVAHRIWECSYLSLRPGACDGSGRY